MKVILGPTACGKTNLATHLAAKIEGEIISADSRQIYRGMNIGTGKDLDEYVIEGKQVPYHLIDIRDAGYEYNVYEFQNDFIAAYNNITSRGKEAILCGGTGMYIEAVLNGYQLIRVPRNDDIRAKLETREHEDLITELTGLGEVHNTTDTSTKKRTIRAIEIALYTKDNPIEEIEFPKIDYTIYGIQPEREIVKQRITKRLKERLENGMIEEVQALLDSGLTLDQIKFYGLEYKFIAQYLNKEMNYNDMYQRLNVAIHQFSRRQMTWYRRMERNGFDINWLDPKSDVDAMVEKIIS